MLFLLGCLREAGAPLFNPDSDVPTGRLLVSAPSRFIAGSLRGNGHALLHRIKVWFSDLTLRLHPPVGGDDEFVEWHAEVGFVDQWRPTWPILVGQVGFLDRFTVTMSRLAQQVAVEDADEFDRRFGVRYVN